LKRPKPPRRQQEANSSRFGRALVRTPIQYQFLGRDQCTASFQGDIIEGHPSGSSKEIQDWPPPRNPRRDGVSQRVLRRSAAPRHHGAGHACDSIFLPRVRDAHRRRRGPPRGAQERRARFEYVPSRRRWRDPVPCVSRGTIRPAIAHPIITSSFLVANNALLPPLAQRGCWCGNNVTPLVRKIPYRRGQRNRAMQTRVLGFGIAHTSRDPSFCMLHQPLPQFAPALREHSPACAAARCDWSGQPGGHTPVCAPR
jgi:hypothetical protein